MSLYVCQYGLFSVGDTESTSHPVEPVKATFLLIAPGTRGYNIPRNALTTLALRAYVVDSKVV